MRRILAVLTALLVIGVAASAPASAHTRVFFGFGFGPVYAPPPYYYPPPPAYYYPPVPAYYVAPPPVVYSPAPTVQAPPSSGYCREYRGNATIDGNNQPFYGTACLQPDGKWHIVN